MPGLPLDGNGSLAAVDAPPMVPAQGPPELGQGQPQVPATPNMDAVAQMFQAPPSPGDAPAPGQAPDNPMARALTSLQPPQATPPKDPEELNLIDQMKKLNENRKQLQQRLQDELSPDSVRRYLPNGGKVKPSDFLADALFNTSQLNLRNPVYGSLKGHDYTPIQQQRMEQALKLHQSAIQNLTQQEAINRDESTSVMGQLQQKRLIDAQQAKEGYQQQQFQLATKKQDDLVKKQTADMATSESLAKARIGLISSQQLKTDLESRILNEYNGNKPSFMADWVSMHRNDPDYEEKYVRLMKSLQPAKDKPGTTVFVPNNTTGGYSVMRVGAGDQIPLGARTIASISTDSSFPSVTQNMISQAPIVLNLADRMEKLVKDNEASLGPLDSRWQDFMNKKIGLPGQDYTQLRVVADILSTKLMQMHVGSRGSEHMMEHFKQLMDTATQSPANLRAALEEIKLYANTVASEKPPNSPQASTSSAPSAIGAPPPPPKPIVQFSKSTGEYRHSLDGGKTWQTGKPSQQQ